jgi:hypothetical protein
MKIFYKILNGLSLTAQVILIILCLMGLVFSVSGIEWPIYYPFFALYLGLLQMTDTLVRGIYHFHNNKFFITYFSACFTYLVVLLGITYYTNRYLENYDVAWGIFILFFILLPMTASIVYFYHAMFGSMEKRINTV